ncbi:HERC2, partial [Symbiodinium microadriaticum]
MGISVDVRLISGRRAIVELEADASVETLRQRAQSALAVGRGRLLNSAGDVLNGTTTLTQAGLQSGDALLLHISQVQVMAAKLQRDIVTGSAFAAILGDGRLVTWGEPDYGGDSSAIQDRLQDVHHVQASTYAFAAILSDGSVVTWGDTDFGGDSSAVQEQLKHVQQIQSSDGAFAAILRDGSVVTWGDADYGGDSSAVQHRLKNVKLVQSAANAFAAILADGSV